MDNDWAIVGRWPAKMVPFDDEMKTVRSADAQALEADLHAAGIPFFDYRGDRYLLEFPKAIPILLNHARRRYPAWLQQTIFYTFAQRGIGEPILSQLVALLHDIRDALDQESLFVLGWAISEVATPKDEDALVAIVKDTANGVGRQSPATRLASLKRGGSSRARDALRTYFRSGGHLPTAIDLLRRAKIWDMASDVRGPLPTSDQG